VHPVTIVAHDFVQRLAYSFCSFAVGHGRWKVARDVVRLQVIGGRLDLSKGHCKQVEIAAFSMMVDEVNVLNTIIISEARQNRT
jgi:hypothetical protein